MASWSHSDSNELWRWDHVFAVPTLLDSPISEAGGRRAVPTNIRAQQISANRAETAQHCPEVIGYVTRPVLLRTDAVVHHHDNSIVD